MSPFTKQFRSMGSRPRLPTGKALPRSVHSRLVGLVAIVLQVTAVLHADEPVQIRRSGFEQLSQGLASDGGQNLYVSRKGCVQTINRQDFNLDGELDLLFTQDHDSVYTSDSLIYWGRADGFHSLLPENWRLRAPFSLLTWLDDSRSRVTRLPTRGGGRAQIADLNGDSYLDIVFANFMHNYRPDQEALIYWGSDFGFSQANRTALPAFLASGVAVGDLNGDGLPEVVLSNRGDERGDSWGYRLHLESYIYWGSANGFDPARRTSVPTISASDVAMGDFNGDGAEDLAFVNFNREQNSAFIYFNDGVGGFVVDGRQVLEKDDWHTTTAGTDGLGPSQDMQTLLAAKLNNDRFDELVIAGTEAAVVFFGADHGLDVDHVVTLPANNCHGMAATDLNGDGQPEIVLANRGQVPGIGQKYRTSSSTIYWASSRGFDPDNRTDLPTLGASTVQIADLNDDGIPDILFGNSYDAAGNDVPSYIYWGGRDGFAEYRRQELTGFGTVGSGIADLNGDDRPDVLLVNRYSGRHEPLPAVIYWGNPGHNYGNASSSLLDVHPHMEHSVADLDDDGYPDFVFLSDRSGPALIVWGSTNEIDSWPRTELPVHRPMSSSVADLNCDGFLDIVFTVPGNLRSIRANARAVILWGNGERFRGARTNEFELSAGGTEANTIADLNRDGWLDLVFPLAGAVSSEIWYGSEDGYRRERSERLPANGSPHAAAADLDDDGWLDLMLTSGADPTRYTVNTPTLIYWGSQQGFTTVPPTEIEGYTALDATVADFNRDGHLDIAMTNYRSDTNRKVPTFVYWGDGSRDFSDKRRTLLKAGSGSAVDALDLNRDGWPELIVSNHQENFDHGAAGTDIFWGGRQGFSRSRRANLPTVGVHLDSMVDAGNIYDRRFRWVYQFDPVRAPQKTSFHRLSWQAEMKLGTSVSFQIRSGHNEQELSKAAWHGPHGPASLYSESGTRVAKVPVEHRWLQYRAVFSSPDGGNTARLYEVVVECDD